MNEHACALRRRMTEAEKLMWSKLRGRRCFWNHDVLRNIDGVLEALVQEFDISR